MANIKSLMHLLIVCCLLLGVSAVQGYSATKEKKAPKHGKLVQQKAQVGTPDEKTKNIKEGEKTNTKDATVPAPPEKGGKARGAGGYTVISNWTPWYVKIYGNGVYQGTVGPWQDGSIYTGDQCPILYGQADFDDGTYKYWGPKTVCNDTWELDQ